MLGPFRDEAVFPSLKDNARSGGKSCPLSWQNVVLFCQYSGHNMVLSLFDGLLAGQCSGLLNRDARRLGQKCICWKPGEKGPKGRNKKHRNKKHEKIRNPNIYSL